ncbi:hypothetical protein [Nocardiopsis sp. NPDC006938]|uniref:hypothetical protein n=1 Tax=Nocardiopsis sp. NPDC006938 TaxID=3364337 RepID=UPI0036C2BC9F
MRPSRHWYWAGALFPVNLLVSIVLLSDNPDASPGLIVGGIVTPILSFPVSLFTCLIVFVIRSHRLTRQRAQRLHGTAAAVPHPGYWPAPHHPGYAPPPPPGYAPAPHHPGYAPPPPQVKIPNRDLRPQRRWLVVSALVLPFGMIVGIASMAGIWNSATKEPPAFASPVIEGSGSVTLWINPEQMDSLALYSTATRDEEDQFHCSLSGGGGPRFTERQTGYTYEGWRLIAPASIDLHGPHTLSCDGPPGMEFVLADTSVVTDYDDRMLLGVATMMLSGFLGFVASLVLLVTLGVRRGSHRDRLVREHQNLILRHRPLGRGHHPPGV